MYRLILMSVFLSACLAGPKFESPVNILRRYVKMFNTYDPCLEYENPDVIDQDIEMKCIGAFNYMDRLPAGDLPLYCLLSQRTQNPSCRNFRGKMRCMITAKHTIVARLMGPSTIHTQIMVMPVPLGACAEFVGVGIPSSENIHAVEDLFKNRPPPGVVYTAAEFTHTVMVTPVASAENPYLPGSDKNDPPTPRSPKRSSSKSSPRSSPRSSPSRSFRQN